MDSDSARLEPEYFVYTGEDGEQLTPINLSGESSDSSAGERKVIRVRVDRNVTKIHDGAFRQQIYLEEVELPEGLLDVGDEAFMHCYGIKDVCIPSTVQRIGTEAFSRCGSLTSVVLNGVTDLGREAFSYCQGLKEVCLAEGLQVIREDTFKWCKSLTSVSFPSTLVEIGAHAFFGCESLATVDLPKGLQTVDANAFYRCTSLEHINTPSTVSLGDTSVYLYAGGEMKVPCSVEHVRVDSSITSIPNGAFERTLLRVIDLPDGITAIGDNAFRGCESLNAIDIRHTSVKTIGANAFEGCISLQSVALPECVEFIGKDAFSSCGMPSLHIPNLVPHVRSVKHSTNLVSVELSERLISLEYGVTAGTFYMCHSLRNVAISPDVVNFRPFNWCTDLRKLFRRNEEAMMHALLHRFDDLPVHKLMYYQSFHPANEIVERLQAIVDPRARHKRKLRSKLNPTGNQQDCLGMTPLHILACSTKQHLEFYRILATKYPRSLVTKDKWGAVPIQYAIWNNAPREIIDFLVDRLKQTFPDHVLDWDLMIQCLGMANAPQQTLQNLLNVKESHFPDQSIDWDTNVDNIASADRFLGPAPSCQTLISFINISIVGRLNAIGVKQWRDRMSAMISNIPDRRSGRRRRHLRKIRTALTSYEEEYQELIGATTIIELVMWKNRMVELVEAIELQEGNRKRKKSSVEDSDFRAQCRISCKVENVIKNVLPYLLPNENDECIFDPSDSDDSSGGDSDSD